MKSYLLILTFTLITCKVFSQVKMDITLNNGAIESGMFKIKDNTLGWATKTKIIAQDTKKKYNLKDINSIVMYSDNDIMLYEVIKVKKYMDSKRVELKLGQVGFKGASIELFYVSEYMYQGGAIGITTTVESYHLTYLKKKNDPIAYNMGYIYGAGQRGIKKRVRDFFNDCPTLIKKVEKNEIEKKETMKIAMFYENNCGK
jgi:hypothetical protein